MRLNAAGRQQNRGGKGAGEGSGIPVFPSTGRQIEVYAVSSKSPLVHLFGRSAVGAVGAAAVWQRNNTRAISQYSPSAVGCGCVFVAKASDAHAPIL